MAGAAAHAPHRARRPWVCPETQQSSPQTWSSAGRDRGLGHLRGPQGQHSLPAPFLVRREVGVELLCPPTPPAPASSPGADVPLCPSAPPHPAPVQVTCDPESLLGASAHQAHPRDCDAGPHLRGPCTLYQPNTCYAHSAGRFWTLWSPCGRHPLNARGDSPVLPSQAEVQPGSHPHHRVTLGKSPLL